MAAKVTKKQLQILSELRSNSRKHLSEIAKKLALPNSTVFDNYNLISRYIKRYVSLIDFEKLGYSLKINFIFNIKNKDIIRKLLLKSPNINSVYAVNSRHTLLAECIFRNTGEAYAFKEALHDNGATRIEMRYIIEELKKEGLLQASAD